MTNQEIIDELKQLSNAERLAVIEAATRLIRADIGAQKFRADDRKRTLSAAAEALLEDYSSDAELTAFTALDSEDFQHA